MLFILTVVDTKYRRESGFLVHGNRYHLVAEMGLSDLALFTEARYTRHPTQTDLHTAFQDHPMAIEHFPSGSLIPPQRH